jgi:hypothetical protein
VTANRVDRQAHAAKYEYHFGIGDPDRSNPYSTSWPLHKYPDHRVVQDWKTDDHSLRSTPYYRVKGPGFENYDEFDTPDAAANHFAEQMGYEQSPISKVYRKRK